MYTPDGWAVIKLTDNNNKVFYKIFGSWSGGYARGDSWRMNSGISKVVDKGSYWEVHGFSGSVYHCMKHAEGKISAYNSHVLYEVLAAPLREMVEMKDIVEDLSQ